MKRRFLKPVLLLVAIAAAGAVVMLLWNAIIPTVVGWGVLSYLQAVGLFVLCRVLGGTSPQLRHRAHFSKAERFGGMSKSQKREYIRNYMSNCEADEQ